MSVLDKIRNTFALNHASEEDDDYFIDDDYRDDYADEDGEPVEEERRPLFRRNGAQSTQRSSASSRSGGFLGRKVVPIDGGHDMEVTMIKPSGMEDARDICDYLLDGKAVVLNMEGMNMDMAQRIIDFTLGAIYSLDGDLQPISKFIFIATPRNVELSGDFQGDLQNAFSDRKVSGGTQPFGKLNFGI